MTPATDEDSKYRNEICKCGHVRWLHRPLDEKCCGAAVGSLATSVIPAVLTGEQCTCRTFQAPADNEELARLRATEIRLTEAERLLRDMWYWLEEEPPHQVADDYDRFLAGQPAPAAAGWSRTAPTEDGWYWWRERADAPIQAMEMKKGVFWFKREWRHTSAIGGEWQGPIRPQ